MADEVLYPELKGTKSFRKNTKFSVMLEEFRTVGICDDALAWCEAQNAANPNATFGEIMQNFIDDPDAKQSWAVFNLQFYGDLLSGTLKDGYLTKVKDPIKAYKLRRDYPDNFTLEQRTLLTNIYSGMISVEPIS